MEFVHLVFTRVPGETCCRRSKPLLLLCSGDVCRTLINSLLFVSWGPLGIKSVRVECDQLLTMMIMTMMIMTMMQKVNTDLPLH